MSFLGIFNKLNPNYASNLNGTEKQTHIYQLPKKESNRIVINST